MKDHTSSGLQLIRVSLAAVIFLLLFLQGSFLSVLNIAPEDYEYDSPNNEFTTPLLRGGTPSANILHETVNLLFMNNITAANIYLKDNPVDAFKFYVHPLPSGLRSVEQISECLENWGYNNERKAYPTKDEFMSTFCDFSASICNPKNYTKNSQYSGSARLNNNMDAVITQLFVNYYGSLRTFNISEATVKVVPYAAQSDSRCIFHTNMRHDNSRQLVLDTNLTKLHDHLFFFTDAKLFVEKWGEGHDRPGQLVVPYANTNAEYQPPDLVSSMSTKQLGQFFASKKFALAALFSAKISGRSDDRVAFATKADMFFGNGTIEHGNGRLGGMPVEIRVMQEKRKLVGEAHAMQLYRDSIFCPSFRGDRPAQKRIFDTILSGCIPVVLAHYYEKDHHNKTSYFVPGGCPNSKVYPWAKGSFGENYPHMGIDYSELVVEIDAKKCGSGGVDCIPTVLEELLNDTAALRKKQHTLAKYARLFSFGMQDNAFQHVDAMSALLVTTRHHVMLRPL